MEGSMSRFVTACAAGVLLVAIGGAAQAQSDVSFTIGVMNWQGAAATAPVQIANTTGAPIRPSDLVCEFISIGRIVGTDRERVPGLNPGDRVTVNIHSDTGGQLVDAVRCRLE
jgi:hypothetical protein